MSAPHTITYDVFFDDVKIDWFDLDADLDLPCDIIDELRKEFKRNWFDARVLFRLPEHVYYGAKSDFIIDHYWYNGKQGVLKLVIADIKDWG